MLTYNYPRFDFVTLVGVKIDQVIVIGSFSVNLKQKFVIISLQSWKDKVVLDLDSEVKSVVVSLVCWVKIYHGYVIRESSMYLKETFCRETFLRGPLFRNSKIATRPYGLKCNDVLRPVFYPNTRKQRLGKF